MSPSVGFADTFPEWEGFPPGRRRGSFPSGEGGPKGRKGWRLRGRKGRRLRGRRRAEAPGPVARAYFRITCFAPTLAPFTVTAKSALPSPVVSP